jgi:hypothetical protein
METKIQKTLTQWFPNAFTETDIQTNHSDYEMLNLFAKYTLKLIEENNKDIEQEPFKIISIMYQCSSLHDKNAIENEFLRVFAKVESPGSLKLHMNLMPKELQQIYLKTILEN